MRAQDLDHTEFNKYTFMYTLARKGAVTLTKDSFDVRAVYRHHRFITIVVKIFYNCARAIPYPILTRGDGVGGVVGRVFLYRRKRMLPDFTDPHLQNPCIDLNELINWGRKGVVFGNREDVDLEVEPFVVGRGGRIKKFSEDKVVDVEFYTDEFDFALVKESMMMTRFFMWDTPFDYPPRKVAVANENENSVGTDNEGNI